jgi:hypothetical protein
MRGDRPTPKERVLAVYPFAFCKEVGTGYMRWQVYSRPAGVHGSNLELGCAGSTTNFAWQHAAMALPKSAGSTVPVGAEGLKP